MTKPVDYLCMAIVPTLVAVGGILYATGVYDKMLYAFHHSKFQAWMDSYISFVPRKFATTWGGGISLVAASAGVVALIALFGYTLHNDRQRAQTTSVS